MSLSDNHQKKINRSLIYIQNHLGNKLSLNTISEVANLSPYHFHRIFKSYSGENLHDYIKRLRLEKAAFMINHSSRPITEIGLSSGYETPASFSKAFKFRFGIPPRSFRKNEIYELEQPEESLQQPTLSTLQPQQVFFRRETGCYQQAATKAWRSLMTHAYSTGLIGEETQALGITYDCPYITEENKIRYDACISLKRTASEQQSSYIQTIAGGRYAIFRHIGAYEKIDSLYRYIYGKWLTQSRETLRDVPGFCHYHQLDPRNVPEEERVTDIYIPVR